MRKWLGKISIPERCGFLSAMVVGFLTHSFIMYNKMSYLDDCIYYFKLGATYSSGRWGLGIIEAVMNWLELQPYSMPLINGLLTIFFIAIMAVLLIRMLGINDSLYAILVGAYMVVFPTVTSTFSYMFTAPCYFFAALLMVLAVYLTRKTGYGTLLAILMIAFGMGIYQAYIGVAAAAFVIVLICDAKEHRFVENITTAIRYLITLVLGIVLYFGLNKFFLWITETELSDYQGINGMLSMSIGDILGGVFNAYKLWPQLTRWEIVGISNTNLIRIMYAVCLLLFLVLGSLYVFTIHKKKDIWNTLYCGVLFLLVPLSLGVIYVMTASSDAYVHTLMVYNLIFIPIYPLVLLENLDMSALKETVKKPIGWLRNIAMAVIAVMAVFYAGLDNAAYLKAYQQQEAALSYYTTLVTQIKSAENYSDELAVAFVGNLDGQDSSISNQSEFDEIQIQGYHANMNTIISYYTTPEYIQLHCGYYFVPANDMEKVYASEEVAQMPCYPKDGAIRVIDDIVVVKFSDIY